MVDSFLNWLGTIDWNSFVENTFSHAFLLLYLPYPIIVIGAYFFLKSIGIPSFWLRLLSALLVMLGCVFYQKTRSTFGNGVVDFQLIDLVAYEYMAGAVLGLLAIVIFCLRGIYHRIKQRAQKRKPLNE